MPARGQKAPLKSKHSLVADPHLKGRIQAPGRGKVPLERFQGIDVKQGHGGKGKTVTIVPTPYCVRRGRALVQRNHLRGNAARAGGPTASRGMHRSYDAASSACAVDALCILGYMGRKSTLWPLVLLSSSGRPNGRTLRAAVPTTHTLPEQTYVEPYNSARVMDKVMVTTGEEHELEPMFEEHRVAVAQFFAMQLVMNLLNNDYRCGPFEADFSGGRRPALRMDDYSGVSNTQIRARSRDGKSAGLSWWMCDPMLVRSIVDLGGGFFFPAHWQSEMPKGTWVDQYGNLRPWGMPLNILDSSYAAGLFYVEGRTSPIGNPVHAPSPSEFSAALENLLEGDSEGPLQLLPRAPRPGACALLEADEGGASCVEEDVNGGASNSSIASGSGSGSGLGSATAYLCSIVMEQLYPPDACPALRMYLPLAAEAGGGAAVDLIGGRLKMPPLPARLRPPAPVHLPPAGGTAAGPSTRAGSGGSDKDHAAGGGAEPSSRPRLSGSSGEATAAPQQQEDGDAEPAWDQQGPAAGFAVLEGSTAAGSRPLRVAVRRRPGGALAAAGRPDASAVATLSGTKRSRVACP